MLWITGSKGLLGSALSLKCRGISELVCTGKEVDIADLNAVKAFVMKNKKITHIVNCAAYSLVDAAEEFSEEAFRTNALGPENLAVVANEIGANLIHISTDYVFSGREKRVLSEKDPASPCSTYGRTKLEGEKRALKHSACVIRTSWLFGNNGKNFVSNLLKMLQTHKEIRLTEDQWSRFTYAPDLSDAILKMLDQKGLYQYANSGVASRYEFGLAMREEALAMGYPIVTDSILPVSGSIFLTPAERPVYSAFDTTKIEQFITIKHWRDALREFLCEQLPAYL